MSQNGNRQYPERFLGTQEVPAPTGQQLSVQQSQSKDQYTALQILTMAQRTAEEHVATSRREAEHIRSEARTAANQIIQESQAQVATLREEAERVMARARASADRMAREAEELASRTEQDASAMLLDARERTEEIIQEAQANARDIRNRAQQAYDDVVGGLSSKRETLQGQIEALERFDREYRARLAAFMQQQLRALWVDQPQSPMGMQDHRQIVELMPGPDEAEAPEEENVPEQTDEE